MRQRAEKMEKSGFALSLGDGALPPDQERLHFLLSTAPTVVYTCEPSPPCGVTFLSGNIRAQLGYEPQEFIGDPNFWANHIHPEDAPRIFAEIPRLFEQGYYSHEYRFLHKDGTYRWIYDEFRAIRDVHGNPTEILGYMIDITKRKQAEEALRESEERYHSMFENSTTATIIVEEDMTIAMANAECEKLFGIPREGIEGKRSWTEFVIKEDLQKMIDYHHKRREKDGEAPAEYEFRFVDNRGNIKDIYLKVGMIPGTKRAIASMMDITDRKRAEQEIRSFPRRLIGVIEEERKRIARDLHDECGKNLTALRFSLEKLKPTHPMGGRKKKGFDEVMLLIEQVGDNIRNIASDMRPDTLDHLGLIPTLEWYIKDISDRIPEIRIGFQAVGFKKRLDPETETVLYRIIQEGLTNVLKHAKAKRVNIQLTCSHPKVILTMKDDGKGFEEKKGLSPSGSRKQGIGLLGMRERVASIGGIINIRSGKGKGTMIRVELLVPEGREDAQNEGLNR